MPEVIIHDGNWRDHLRANTGGVPRDFSVQPAPRQAVDIKLIPRSEWSARIKELREKKALLSDVRNAGNNGRPIPSINQGQWGYCWAHSSTQANILLRAVAGLPYVPLSAFMVAAIIKNGRDEGGWGALSLDFIAKNGQPDVKYWPQQDASLRHDTPEMRANAALHKVQGGWIDMAQAVYDRDLSFDQVATLLLSGRPVVVDYNWWGHSVLALDLVEVEAGSYGLRIWNSWGDEWSENGTGILQGSRAIPDGAVAPGVATASEE